MRTREHFFASIRSIPHGHVVQMGNRLKVKVDSLLLNSGESSMCTCPHSTGIKWGIGSTQFPISDTDALQNNAAHTALLLMLPCSAKREERARSSCVLATLPHHVRMQVTGTGLRCNAQVCHHQLRCFFRCGLGAISVSLASMRLSRLICFDIVVSWLLVTASN